MEDVVKNTVRITRKSVKGTYNTPMTLLTMDWNSSSVYSGVGNGATLKVEGLNCFQGLFRCECNEVESKDDCPSASELVISCCAANIMNESITC